MRETTVAAEGVGPARRWRRRVLLCFLLATTCVLPFATSALAAPMSLPTGGTVTTEFLKPITYESSGQYIDSTNTLRSAKFKFHHGIDISGGRSPGSYPVYAAAGGTVAAVFYDKGYGQQVIIDHGGGNGRYTYTCYGHMGLSSKTTHVSYVPEDIAAGRPVARGQLIGYQGTDGNSTGVHLDWEVRVASKPIKYSPKMRSAMIAADPAYYLGFSPTYDSSVQAGPLAPRCVANVQSEYIDQASIVVTAEEGWDVKSVTCVLDGATTVTDGASAKVETDVLGNHALSCWATTISGSAGPKLSATFSVVGSGRVTATVYDAHAMPLWDVPVTVEDAATRQVRGTGITGILGQCTIGSLPAGNYRVYFGSPLNEWYDDSGSYADSAVVTVIAGETASLTASLGIGRRIDEFAVCLASGAQEVPDVSGSTIVYQDNRNMDGASRIFAFNTATKTEQPIAYGRYPRIAGNLVVFQTLSYDIAGYDLNTGTEFSVCSAPGFQVRPDVSGSVVVWQDWRDRDSAAGEHPDIYAYDLQTQTEQLVCRTAGPASTAQYEVPRISGRTVVWPDFRDGSWDVYGYDLTSRQEFAVAVGPDDQLYAAIHGSNVVWAEVNESGTSTAIYGKDLQAGTSFTVRAPRPTTIQPPDIDFPFVTWSDDDVYGYDLRNGDEFVVCNVEGVLNYQWVPAVSGPTFVWQDFRNGNYFSESQCDIYAATVSP